MLQQMLEGIFRPLVDRPEALEIKQTIADSTLIYEIFAHKDDMGKIIGKQGKNISAARTLLNAAATKAKKRVILTANGAEFPAITTEQPLQRRLLKHHREV